MSKTIRFVAVGDNHGDMVDEHCFNGLKQFLVDFKPHHRIHLGDCFDFRSIRRGVSVHDREGGESLKADIEAGEAFIRMFRPTAFLYGNHEDRLDQLIHGSSNALVRDYAESVNDKLRQVLRKNGCKDIYSYHADLGVHRVGPVAFVHGYSCHQNAVAGHAQHFSVPGGATIMGHIHSIQQANAAKHGGCVGFSGGCLCRIEDMSYAKRFLGTSKWGNGWVYGIIRGNEWKVWQCHKVANKWLYITAKQAEDISS